MGCGYGTLEMSATWTSLPSDPWQPVKLDDIERMDRMMIPR
jgi:hypothetical protein